MPRSSTWSARAAVANSQLYSAAKSRDQAGLLYALAAKVVRMSPRLMNGSGFAPTTLLGSVGSGRTLDSKPTTHART